jgi:hypothetical protein
MLPWNKEAISIKSDVDQLLKLAGEQFEVPEGIERELVLGEHERAGFDFVEVRNPDHRHFIQTGYRRRFRSCMPSENDAIFADDDRHVES